MPARDLGDDAVAALWESNALSWTTQVRSGLDVFRDALNTPAFLQMLPSVRALRGLDIGCGEGSNTRQLARLGASMTALDIAPTFVRQAAMSEQSQPLGIDYRHGDGMHLPFAADAFDFVTAFMSLMDMPQPQQAIGEASRVLAPGGFLQFSVLHPCFMPPYRRVLRDDQGAPRALELGEYFSSTTGRIDRWWFSSLTPDHRKTTEPFRTPIFHRTLAQWLNMVIDAGLVIEEIREPTADPGAAAATGVLAESRVAPISLLLRARKASTGAT